MKPWAVTSYLQEECGELIPFIAKSGKSRTCFFKIPNNISPLETQN